MDMHRKSQDWNILPVHRLLFFIFYFGLNEDIIPLFSLSFLTAGAVLGSTCVVFSVFSHMGEFQCMDHPQWRCS